MAKLGHSSLKGIRRKLEKLRFRVARNLMGRCRLQDEGYTLEFQPHSFRERWRISSIFLKEPGTINLIRQEVREGDVFCDIGANIGLYSVMAAPRVGEAGQVYAFEPLAANFASLVENIRANDTRRRVIPFSCALTDQEGFFPFHYSQLEAGASGSQLHNAISDQEQPYEPLLTEQKYGTSIDHLIDVGTMRPPTIIKLDVDGNEARILRGMHNLLSGAHRPRIVMVEVNAREKDELFDFMHQHGYEFTARNDTMGGLTKMRKGADPQAVAYNAVFRPAETA